MSFAAHTCIPCSASTYNSKLLEMNDEERFLLIKPFTINFMMNLIIMALLKSQNGTYNIFLFITEVGPMEKNNTTQTSKKPQPY